MTEERNPKETGMRDVPKNLKPYFLGLLRRGPRWNEIEGAEAAELLAAASGVSAGAVGGGAICGGRTGRGPRVSLPACC